MAEIGFRLRVCAGPDAGRELLVRNPGMLPVTIGRKPRSTVQRSPLDPNRDLVCSDDAISRRHATIDFSGHSYVLTDRGSVNGTTHNGRPLAPETPVALQSGDELRFAADTVVKFELLEPLPEKPAPPQRPAPAEDVTAFAPARASVKPKPVVTLRRADELPKASEHFGRYAVLKLLDRDNTERVDLAIDTKTQAQVALKRFTLSLPRRALKRLLEDAERARRWRHPNIAEVLDAGVEAGTLFIASRFVDGVSLATICDRCAHEVDPPFATYVVREACQALRYAAGAVPGFVHRNLRPRTIMLSQRGDVVLINFGFVQPKALLEHTVSLTPTEARYLSPEHLKRRGLDPRSDVFSLGVILYELLAQEPIDPRRKSILPDVDSVQPEVPPQLADITMRAVALRPEVRFRTPGEMATELTEALEALAPGYGPQAATSMMKRFPAFSAA